MPSLLHEGLLALVRERPAFAAELLRDLLDVPVPAFTAATLADATSKSGAPVDYTADAVVLLGGRERSSGFVVEIQRRPKPDKLFTWPLYAVDQRSRHKCPVVVLVVTPSAATARWAAQPIELGGGNVAGARRGPEGHPRGHGHREGNARAAPDDALASDARPRPGRLGRGGRRHRSDGRRRDAAPRREDVIFQLIEASLGRAARKTFKMLPQGQRVFSANFAKGESTGFAKGESTGFAKGESTGFAKGESTGFAKGESTGFAKGEAKGKATAILLVLKSRGMAVSAEQRQRILNCTRAATLDTWLKKAVTANTVGQLLRSGRRTA